MKKSALHQASKALVLFLFGAVLYAAIEIMWRGYTHWTMAALGGLLFLLLGGLNNWLPWDMPLLWQIIIGHRDCRRVCGRLYSQSLARPWNLGLLQSPREHPWPDLPTVHACLGGTIPDCHCVG